MPDNDHATALKHAMNQCYEEAARATDALWREKVRRWLKWIEEGKGGLAVLEMEQEVKP